MLLLKISSLFPRRTSPLSVLTGPEKKTSQASAEILSSRQISPGLKISSSRRKGAPCTEMAFTRWHRFLSVEDATGQAGDIPADSCCQGNATPGCKQVETAGSSYSPWKAPGRWLGFLRITGGSREALLFSSEPRAATGLPCYSGKPFPRFPHLHHGARASSA